MVPIVGLNRQLVCLACALQNIKLKTGAGIKDDKVRLPVRGDQTNRDQGWRVGSNRVEARWHGWPSTALCCCVSWHQGRSSIVTRLHKVLLPYGYMILMA